jgi:hypothetical protein
MKLGFYIPVIGGANEKKWEQVVQTLAARAAPEQRPSSARVGGRNRRTRR